MSRKDTLLQDACLQRWRRKTQLTKFSGALGKALPQLDKEQKMLKEQQAELQALRQEVSELRSSSTYQKIRNEANKALEMARDSDARAAAAESTRRSEAASFEKLLAAEKQQKETIRLQVYASIEQQNRLLETLSRKEQDIEWATNEMEMLKQQLFRMEQRQKEPWDSNSITKPMEIPVKSTQTEPSMNIPDSGTHTQFMHVETQTYIHQSTQQVQTDSLRPVLIHLGTQTESVTAADVITCEDPQSAEGYMYKIESSEGYKVDKELPRDEVALHGRTPNSNSEGIFDEMNDQSGEVEAAKVSPTPTGNRILLKIVFIAWKRTAGLYSSKPSPRNLSYMTWIPEDMMETLNSKSRVKSRDPQVMWSSKSLGLEPSKQREDMPYARENFKRANKSKMGERSRTAVKARTPPWRPGGRQPLRNSDPVVKTGRKSQNAESDFDREDLIQIQTVESGKHVKRVTGNEQVMDHLSSSSSNIGDIPDLASVQQFENAVLATMGTSSCEKGSLAGKLRSELLAKLAALRDLVQEYEEENGLSCGAEVGRTTAALATKKPSDIRSKRRTHAQQLHVTVDRINELLNDLTIISTPPSIPSQILTPAAPYAAEKPDSVADEMIKQASFMEQGPEDFSGDSLDREVRAIAGGGDLSKHYPDHLFPYPIQDKDTDPTQFNHKQVSADGTGSSFENIAVQKTAPYETQKESREWIVGEHNFKNDQSIFVHGGFPSNMATAEPNPPQVNEQTEGNAAKEAQPSCWQTGQPPVWDYTNRSDQLEQQLQQDVPYISASLPLGAIPCHETVKSCVSMCAVGDFAQTVLPRPRCPELVTNGSGSVYAPHQAHVGNAFGQNVQLTKPGVDVDGYGFPAPTVVGGVYDGSYPQELHGTHDDHIDDTCGVGKILTDDLMQQVNSWTPPPSLGGEIRENAPYFMGNTNDNTVQNQGDFDGAPLLGDVHYGALPETSIGIDICETPRPQILPQPMPTPKFENPAVENDKACWLEPGVCFTPCATVSIDEFPCLERLRLAQKHYKTSVQPLVYKGGLTEKDIENDPYGLGFMESKWSRDSSPTHDRPNHECPEQKVQLNVHTQTTPECPAPGVSHPPQSPRVSDASSGDKVSKESSKNERKITVDNCNGNGSECPDSKVNNTQKEENVGSGKVVPEVETEEKVSRKMEGAQPVKGKPDEEVGKSRVGGSRNKRDRVLMSKGGNKSGLKSKVLGSRQSDRAIHKHRKNAKKGDGGGGGGDKLNVPHMRRISSTVHRPILHERRQVPNKNSAHHHSSNDKNQAMVESIAEQDSNGLQNANKPKAVDGSCNRPSSQGRARKDSNRKTGYGCKVKDEAPYRVPIGTYVAAKITTTGKSDGKTGLVKNQAPPFIVGTQNNPGFQSKPQPKSCSPPDRSYLPPGHVPYIVKSTVGKEREKREDVTVEEYDTQVLPSLESPGKSVLMTTQKKDDRFVCTGGNHIVAESQVAQDSEPYRRSRIRGSQSQCVEELPFQNVGSFETEVGSPLVVKFELLKRFDGKADF